MRCQKPFLHPPMISCLNPQATAAFIHPRIGTPNLQFSSYHWKNWTILFESMYSSCREVSVRIVSLPDTFSLLWNHVQLLTKLTKPVPFPNGENRSVFSCCICCLHIKNFKCLLESLNLYTHHIYVHVCLFQTTLKEIQILNLCSITTGWIPQLFLCFSVLHWQTEQTSCISYIIDLEAVDNKKFYMYHFRKQTDLDLESIYEGQNLRKKFEDKSSVLNWKPSLQQNLVLTWAAR